MTTKRASEVQVGDKVVSEETGERLTVRGVSQGFWHGSVLFQFSSKTAGNDFACVDKAERLEVEAAR